jgi:hypothetical protein
MYDMSQNGEASRHIHPARWHVSLRKLGISEGPMDSAALFALQLRQNSPYKTPDPPSAFST